MLIEPVTWLLKLCSNAAHKFTCATILAFYDRAIPPISPESKRPDFKNQVFIAVRELVLRLPMLLLHVFQHIDKPGRPAAHPVNVQQGPGPD